MSRSSGRTIDARAREIEAADQVGSSSDDGDRAPRGLALHEVARCRDLVGDARHGHHERAALGIRPPRRSSKTCTPRRADRGVGLPLAPCATERVGDDDADLDAEQRRAAPTPGPRAEASGSTGSSSTVPSGGVRGVDARGGRHDAEPVLHDAGGSAVRGRAGRDDPDRLGGDRVLAVVGRDHPALGLRDDLRRHHEDVAVGEDAGCGIRDHADEIRAGGDLGNALERPDLQHVRASADEPHLGERLTQERLGVRGAVGREAVADVEAVRAGVVFGDPEVELLVVVDDGVEQLLPDARCRATRRGGR